MDVEIIASRVSDNYFYAIHDNGEAALIDPVDGTAAVEWVRQSGVELRYLINTHFHQDHTGGNPTVLDSFPGAEWAAGAGDASRIVGQVEGFELQHQLGLGDELELGGTRLQVLETPGHTPGHISLLEGEHLFSGDTIFVGGAGNCNFGGDPGRLFKTFRDVLSEIDGSVTFYPGHDYSVRDLEFIESIEPDNERAGELLERAESTPEDEIFLTTLAEERAYSPFFRYDEEPLRERLRQDHTEVWESCAELSRSEEETAFRCVRELRNRW
jgi:hydroxyacylglutathione hydrolase